MSEQIQSSDWRKTFFLIWTGQLFSILGSGLVSFALVWYLTQKTGSAAVLATATFVSLLPGVFLGPFAGALVDRWNRKTVMILADAAIAATTAGIALLFLSGQVQIWHIYVLNFIRALGGAFHYPAMAASTSLLVPEKHLSRVAGINQALQGALGIVAPPLGALLLSLLPMQGILAIDVVTAMIAIVPLLFVAIPQPARRLEGEITPRVLLRDVREGLRYVSAWPGLIIVLVMATMINFLASPAFSLLPLLVTKTFNGGAMQLGIMESALGIGFIVGGLGLGIWGGFRKKVFTSMTGLIGMGAAIALIGATPGSLFWLAVAGMAAAGIMNPITNGPLHALLQSSVAPEMQGRVFTLIGSLSSAMSPLGMLAAAPVAEALGVRAWFLTAGVFCSAMGLMGFFIRSLIRLEDDLKQAAPQGAAPAQD